ncbi:SDR family NAD(P)-dependent oxidoreductase [Halalkalibaculum sp. DA3122]|uniref:SDR family NAD(P)-dependent oxidoreductase n=1 Tax=unclassified Halalkalibaculum TaxID=2964617 RepID=UPI003754F6AE
MQEIIITGASRGFGQEVAIELAETGRRLHLISRSKAGVTAGKVRDKGGQAEIWAMDLSLTDRLEDNFELVLDAIQTDEADFIGLINNAGTIEPIGPLGKYDVGDYRTNLELNYVAPAVLTHLFVNRFQLVPAIKRVLFVGSGASGRPIHGWSHYCSSKAGVDMLAQTVAVEQQTQEHPVESAVFNPGRIETNMQKIIRGKDEEDFPLVDDFIASATDGRNLPPAQMAKKLAQIYLGENYPHGEIVGR